MNHAMTRLVAGVALIFAASTAIPAFGELPWDKTFPNGDKRFKVLSDLNNAAALDKETGLVWQLDPSIMNFNTWAGAIANCQRENIGGRGGWRLPTVEEFRSVMNPTRNNPALSLGHPFLNLDLTTPYWTVTRSHDISTFAFAVELVAGSPLINDKGVLYRVWCVRGGQGPDGL
ncbi:MAG: DUF1566 domain-containing protein [Nitrospira sp.]